MAGDGAGDGLSKSSGYNSVKKQCSDTMVSPNKLEAFGVANG